MNEVEIIQGARELLSDPASWGKGSSRPTPTSHCMYHALATASGSTWVFDEQGYFAAIDLVRRHVPRGLIQDYNDAEGTTHADILNLLDKCLADLGALA